MIETGVSFNDIHSFYDLNLILSSVEISPAIPKTTYVNVPGRDGALDLTEGLGEVKFDDRIIKFIFTVHPSDRMTFEERKTAVANAVNGLRCKITLDKDPDYYYEGRCKVDAYAQNKNLKQITISVTVQPYKLKHMLTVKTFSLSSTAITATLENERKTVVPAIECTADNTHVVFNGNDFSLGKGTHKILDICLTAGKHPVTLYGSGTITFTYQEGAL